MPIGKGLVKQGTEIIVTYVTIISFSIKSSFRNRGRKPKPRASSHLNPMFTDLDNSENLMSDSSSIAWLLVDATRIMGTEFSRRLKDNGINLSRTQWRIIARLHRSNGRTQTELAEQMAMEKAPLGVILEKLELAELIFRRVDKRDGRVKRVYLTPKAEQMTPELDSTLNALLEDMFEGLSQTRRLQFSQALTHILQNSNQFKETNR